jgi:hypothetical protein
MVTFMFCSGILTGFYQSRGLFSSRVRFFREQASNTLQEKRFLSLFLLVSGGVWASAHAPLFCFLSAGQAQGSFLTLRENRRGRGVIDPLSPSQFAPDNGFRRIPALVLPSRVRHCQRNLHK